MYLLLRPWAPDSGPASPYVRGFVSGIGILHLVAGINDFRLLFRRVVRGARFRRRRGGMKPPLKVMCADEGDVAANESDVHHWRLDRFRREVRPLSRSPRSRPARLFRGARQGSLGPHGHEAPPARGRGAGRARGSSRTRASTSPSRRARPGSSSRRPAFRSGPSAAKRRAGSSSAARPIRRRRRARRSNRARISSCSDRSSRRRRKRGSGLPSRPRSWKICPPSLPKEPSFSSSAASIRPGSGRSRGFERDSAGSRRSARSKTPTIRPPRSKRYER